VGTVKNYFTALHKQGRAVPLGDGRWTTLSQGQKLTDDYDYDN
jgi:hypothetical protein